jgi:hypothetical protein
MRTKAFCLLVVALVLVPTVLITAARGLAQGVLHAAAVLLGGSGG